MGEKVALVDAGAVQLGAKDMLEMTSEIKMVDDPPGKDVRLAGGDEHSPGRLLECSQYLRNVGIDAVLEQSDTAKSLAVELNAAIGEAVITEQSRKARAQWWPDAPDEFVLRWHRAAQLSQRILDGAGDAGLGIGQRAVEIEEQRGLSWHSAPSSHAKFSSP